MTTVQVLCVDNLPVVVNLDDIRDACPPVLARFFGMVDGFAEPPKDEHGQLTFPKTYGIIQKTFADMIAFLRTGHVRFHDDTSHAFNVLGGCDAFDEKVRDKDALLKQEQEYHRAMRTRKLTNPMTKEDDVHDVYVFEPHPNDWEHTAEWECCKPVTTNHVLYWWRKRKEGI